MKTWLTNYHERALSDAQIWFVRLLLLSDSFCLREYAARRLPEDRQFGVRKDGPVLRTKEIRLQKAMTRQRGSAAGALLRLVPQGFAGVRRGGVFEKLSPQMQC